MLAGKLYSEINTFLYGGQLIALSKTNGGVHPIVVGYFLRKLAAKCANSHAIEARSKVLQPKEHGVGVAGGVETAIHATRQYINQIP